MILIVYLVILSAYFNVVLAMIVAFLLGIVKNMWFGEMIGTSSLLYVIIVYAVHLYKRKFNARSLGFLCIVSVIVILVSEIIESQTIAFSQGYFIQTIITSFVYMVIFKIVYTLWGRSEDERKLPG